MGWAYLVQLMGQDFYALAMIWPTSKYSIQRQHLLTKPFNLVAHRMRHQKLRYQAVEVKVPVPSQCARRWLRGTYTTYLSCPIPCWVLFCRSMSTTDIYSLTLNISWLSVRIAFALRITSHNFATTSFSAGQNGTSFLHWSLINLGNWW